MSNFVFNRGDELSSNDLFILFRDVQGRPRDVYDVTYFIYDYTDNVNLILIAGGTDGLTPVKLGTGEYYAPYKIPDAANIGEWRIHWRFRETDSGPFVLEKQRFAVVGICVQTAPGYTDAENYYIHELRKELRDNNPDRNYSIYFNELCEVDIDGETLELNIGELYESIYENIKNKIKKAFFEKKLKIKSVDKDGNISLKTITDVLQHDTIDEEINEVVLKNGQSVVITTGHGLYKLIDHKPIEFEVKDLNIGDKIVVLNNNQLEEIEIVNKIQHKHQEHMYDLSVQGNQNFFLKSGILAHNSFQPPRAEEKIQGYTENYGYIWTDDELHNYLSWATGDINAFPTITNFNIENWPQDWTGILLIRAGIYALRALAINWAGEEFNYSISGISLDIDKMSKYQAMKENFESDYERTIEVIKSHYVVLRGLRQPHWGIGIGGGAQNTAKMAKSIKNTIIRRK